MNKVNVKNLAKDMQSILFNVSDCKVNLLESELIVNMFMDEIFNYVKNDKTVKLGLYCDLVPNHRKERFGTHPQTHEQIVIEENKSVKLKVQTKLKKYLND